MSSLKQMSSEIERFLVGEREEALCIFGDWGIGKTYTWNVLLTEAIQNAKVSKRRYSYASLFGLSSLDGLKSAIFENTEFIIDPNDEADELKEAKKAGNKLLEVAKKNRNLLAAIPIVGKALAEAGPMYFSSVWHQIVCIDDLERRGAGLSIQDVLGLASFLKEKRKCKVVLLLNDNELGSAKADFTDNFEKVFDSSLRFMPTPSESASIVLTDNDNISQILRTSCEKLKISNIRVIVKIDRFARMLETHLTGLSESLMEQAMSALTLFCFCKFLPRSAPSIEYIKTGHLRALMRVNSSEVPAEESAWRNLLNSYGYASMNELDQHIIAGIENGFFDPVAMRSAAEAADESIESTGRNSPLSKGWDLFRHDFNDNLDDVAKALENGIRNSREVSFINLDATVKLLKQLGRTSEAQNVIDAFMEKYNGNINPRFWDLSNHHFGEISDPDVIATFQAKLATVQVTPNPTNILLKIAEREGWDPEEVSFLAKWPIESYKEMLLASSGEELQAIIKGGLFFAKISDGDHNMKEVANRMKAALSIIAETNELNRLRVNNLTGISSR